MVHKLLAAATLMSLVFVCAPFAQARNYSLSPDQRSLVDQTCIQVMGLKRGETQFAGCRAGLSQALAARSGSQPLAATYASGDIEAGKSFFAVSPIVRWNREHYSCARLGLAPGSTLFGQCVDSLEDAFMPTPN
jgi:hypothetical protein